MATVAIIQNLYPELNTPDPKELNILAQKLYEQFFEVLVEESGHNLQLARALDNYQVDQAPDLVICAPFPSSGNLAPGFMELVRFQEAFKDTPIIVWSDREETALQKSAIEDYGVAYFYTGNLIDAPEDFADLIIQYAK
ncbi:MAG: hypothetical protein H6673_11810 [Anaerolineales bacterium]|nr:hypothetical protein [Anaerolineales bacterium]